jgi:hypothetical protein
MGKFGWSYPPGCNSVPGDEPEPPCEVCGQFVDYCICPECPVCGEIGNPACYQEVDLGICGGLHGKETWAQKIGKAKLDIAMLENQIADIQTYISYLEDENMKTIPPE